MWKSEVQFLFMKEEMAFALQSVSQEPITDFFVLFTHQVDRENKIIRFEVQQNSGELRKRIDSYVAEYGRSVMPVRQLQRILSKLRDGEYFFFLPNMALEPEELMNLHAALISLNEGRDFEQLRSSYKDLFGTVWQNYRTIVRDNTHRIRIGPRDKKKRVCRFCGKSQPDVHFRRKAHAISKALGNKNVILNEECDQCNDYFGRAIEKDLTTLLDFPRRFFGGPDKKEKARTKGSNFSLQSGNSRFEIMCSDVITDQENILKSVKLQHHEKIVLQHAYRALCKFVLSVIDRPYLQFFETTIEWVKGKRVVTRLPKIGLLITPGFLDTAPSITIYLRKVNDSGLPHLVGEFHFASLTLVFIVPCSSEDEKDFCADSEFGKFWKCFKHFDRAVGWTFLDLSDDTARGLTLKIDFEERKGMPRS